MSTKTVNAKMMTVFEEEVISYAPPKDWADKLTTINDMLTDYLLDDVQYIGNRDTSSVMYQLRHLRDFFKDLDDLAH